MRYITLFLLMFCVSSINAQKGSAFGIKAGLNYSSNGDYIETVNTSAQNPDSNVGYHIGIFGKLGNKLYLRPELVYTKTESSYEKSDFSVNKLDVPVLVGLKVYGPLNIFVGPTFQYILSSEFDNISIDNIENDFSVGFNFGVGINIKKIGIDLRYERGFNENEASFIQNNSNNNVVSRLDTRPSQLILSISITVL